MMGRLVLLNLKKVSISLKSVQKNKGIAGQANHNKLTK